ncbi:MAG: hypothetical protein NTV58_19025 [Deltaproteobacteria bacterium]|nr:hypothetical protein [Deltaproteobacteria bacterium]
MNKPSKWMIVHNLKLGVLFLGLIGVAIALQFLGNEGLSSLGSNLVAEFIGAAVTIYGVDYLIKRREERRLLPVRAASYEDVRIMTHWALDLWKSAYINSVGDSSPKNWAELFSEDTIKKIQMSLDITKPANVIPAEPWSTYFDREMEKIHTHAEKVLERHAVILDPEIHGAVYTLVYYNHHKISDLIAFDKQLGIPRPTCLGSYVPIIRNWFDAVLTMQTWTIAAHQKLTCSGIVNIHSPYTFSPLEEKALPPARFDDGALDSQLQHFSQWQNQRAVARKAV